jgi:hypothetical protein
MMFALSIHPQNIFQIMLILKVAKFSLLRAELPSKPVFHPATLRLLSCSAPAAPRTRWMDTLYS